MTLLFHLFNIQRTSGDSKRDQSLPSLRQGKKMFEVFIDNIKFFKCRYYLVTPLIEASHVSIYEDKSNLPPRYIYKFLKFYRQNHFLARLETFKYPHDDLPQEETYLKNKFTTF